MNLNYNGDQVYRLLPKVQEKVMNLFLKGHKMIEVEKKDRCGLSISPKVQECSVYRT